MRCCFKHNLFFVYFFKLLISINFTLTQRRKQDVMTAKTPNGLNQHLYWENSGLFFIKLNLFVNFL